MPAKRTRRTTSKRTTKTRSTARKKTTSRPRGPVHPTLPAPPSGQRHWVLDVPWHKPEDPVDYSALARGFGAQYVATVGYVYTGPSIPEPLTPCTPSPYSWQALDEALLNGDPWTTSPDGPPMDASTGAITLRPGQETGAQAITAAYNSLRPEFLDASDVGTGKTYSALAAVKRIGAGRCLVIAPASVFESWVLALDQIEPGGVHFTVVNAESLQHLTYHPAATKASSPIKQAAKAGVGKVAWDVVITDEAHTFKNPTSYATRTRERIITGPKGAAAPFLLTMSATAGKDPSDLAYLHRGISAALNTPDCGLEGYANLVQTRLGIEVTESRFGTGDLTWDKDSDHAADDLETINRTLFEGFPTWGIHRTADWGDPPRHLVPVDLTPAQQAQYLLDWAEFQHATAKAERAYARAKTGKAKATAKAQGLAAQTRYRQKAGLLRAPQVAADALAHLADGKQVAISCEFIATADAIQASLDAHGVPTATYTGQNREHREDERRRFQTGQATAVVFTPTAGFSLHAGEEAVDGNQAPRVLLVAEPRWAPIPARQIEGRTHRDGKIAPAYYYFAKGTIEEKVLTRSIEGMGSQAVMLGNDKEAVRAIAKEMGVARIW